MKKNSPQPHPTTSWWDQPAAPHDQIWYTAIIIVLILSSIAGYQIGHLIGQALPKDLVTRLAKIISLVIIIPPLIYLGWGMLGEFFSRLWGIPPPPAESEKFSPPPESVVAPPERPIVPAPRLSVWSFKKWRKENKLTQKQLGKMLGISPRTISAWENYRAQPTPEILQKLRALKSQYENDSETPR